MSGQVFFKCDGLLHRIDEDDCLADVEHGVEVQKSGQLVCLHLHLDVELTNTIQSEFLLLDQDLNWVVHHQFCHLENFSGHCSRKKDNLGRIGQELEDVLDLSLKSTGQHLISFVQDEHFDVVGGENTAVHHIKDTARRADDDMLTFGDEGKVISDAGSTDARVAVDLQDMANIFDNLESKK